MSGAGPRPADGAPEGAAGSPAGEPAALLADVCACRAAVYQALVLGFREPTAGYIEALAGGELVEGLREAVAWLGAEAAAYEPALAGLHSAAAAAAGSERAEALAGLAVEYARLFTGPGRPAVMCYATQYLDPDERKPWVLNGAAAAYAAAAYQAEGVAPVDSPRELPDHVTVELEFLFHLCRREEAAWDAGASDEAARLRRSQTGFLADHAAPFFRAFAQAVLAAGPAELYGALAALLDAHVDVELGGRVSDGHDPGGPASPSAGVPGPAS